MADVFINYNRFWKNFFSKKYSDFKTLFNYATNLTNIDTPNFLLASYLILNADEDGFKKIKKNQVRFHKLLKKFDIYDYDFLNEDNTCCYDILSSEKVKSKDDLNKYFLHIISRCNNAELLGEFFYQMIKNTIIPDHFKTAFREVTRCLLYNYNIAVFTNSIRIMCKKIVENCTYYDSCTKFSEISCLLSVKDYYFSDTLTYGGTVCNLFNSIRLAVDNVTSKEKLLKELPASTTST